MILGGKYGKRRSIRSEDFFWFFLENGMIWEKNTKKRDRFKGKAFSFLKIIMIFGEKLQSARSKPSFVFREHQFLRILSSGL